MNRRTGWLGLCGILALSGAALLLAGLHQRTAPPSFYGELRVGLNATERTVLRPALPPSPSSPSQNSVYAASPGASIPFDDPATAQTWVSAERVYDAAQLPFAVELTALTTLEQPTPKDSLEITEMGQSTSIPLMKGTVVPIAGEEFTVGALRTWGGLLAEPGGNGGTSQAIVAVQEGDGPWTENILLIAGQWTRHDENTTFYLEWFDSEEALQAALKEVPLDLDTARWGIVEDAATNWFESFTPGMGMELADGRSITLVRVDEQHAFDNGQAPALLIEVTDKSQRTAHAWIRANAQSKSLVRFEYPGLLRRAIRLYAWQDNVVTVVAAKSGEPAGQGRLEMGQAWAPYGDSWRLRVDQVLQSAVAVSAGKSPIREAVLHGPARTLRLRQGESARYKDLYLQFHSDASPPDAVYDLTLHGKEEKTEQVPLSPQTRYRRGPWVLAQGNRVLNQPDTAVLYVEYRPRTPWVLLGIALMVAGGLFLGLLLLRGAPESGKP